ncbi:erythromycin esterase family protein [Evansella sp. AB-P1]|uniref:erythromycin esterase family protein n=1 Tax=Evansella sp. AB-P1 TaxID=3037653 RepID=UPI00241F9098|nr:erythromycin esterase family protein [Evansella sp. AB-P1]MDG5786072.1 erythromycin esterase family protein [Evansella sp. AB-P1]
MLKTNKLVNDISEFAVSFTYTSELKPLIQKARNAKFALLGEATHGTSEFYTYRADLTKQLIKEHSFSFIAVEGDWPACYEVNRYVKGLTPEYSSAEDVLKKSFQRWPSWMWANNEMVDLVEWLYEYNHTNPNEMVGFYGLDVYSLWESMEAIVDYLKKTKSPHINKALQAIECFEPYKRNPEMYGISAAFYGEDCMNEIMELLLSLQENKTISSDDPESVLNMKVNGIVTRNAEHYYHTMVTNDNESWNIRDRHMIDALQYISEFYGATAKGIVWEHNTHIGDARATDMANEGMVNVGQLARENYGKENVYAIGLGTYEGTVIAADKWGDKPKILTVPAGSSGSFEESFHYTGKGNQYIMFTEDNKHLFQNNIGHRAIGVVYNPSYDQYGNYVPTRPSERYDAFIHIDKTKALTPLI